MISGNLANKSLIILLFISLAFNLYQQKLVLAGLYVYEYIDDDDASSRYSFASDPTTPTTTLLVVSVCDGDCTVAMPLYHTYPLFFISCQTSKL